MFVIKIDDVKRRNRYNVDCYALFFQEDSMSVLSKEDKSLLNSFADSQPALNEEGKQLGDSQVKLGDLMDYASGSSAAKFKWDFAVNGATGTIKLGDLPAGAIVTAIALDKLGSTVDSTDATISLDGNDLLANVDLSLLADVSLPAGLITQKAAPGELTIAFAVAPTQGTLQLLVSFLCANAE